jgi:hypothetical protein
MTDLRFRRSRPGPGGVDDGLPQLPSGEPLLQRWFAVSMVVLVPVAIGVTLWAFTAASGSAPTISPAERRPPGTETVSHERGDALLNEVREEEAGPGCAEEVTIIGDESARAAGRRALSAMCQLLGRDEFTVASTGLSRWVEQDGVLRFAVFEMTGVASSARLEDGRVVVELNAKYQFVPGAHASPAIIHALVHLAHGWPGAPVTADAELAAVQAEHAACERLTFRDGPPRACQDAEEILGLPDPLGALVQAGFLRAESR